MNDTNIEEIMAELLVNKMGPNELEIKGGLLKYRGKWVVGINGDLRRRIFEELHEQGVGGHSGIRATTKRIEQYFFWPGLKKDVEIWVTECLVCQKSKHENIHNPGLLLLLPIPHSIWQDISMDFISGLPNSRGFEIIWVISDRFSRYSHFIALKYPISAKSLAQSFFENIFKLHGLPSSITSDRDPLFLSEFWQTLSRLVGTKLHMSTSYHPQSDGCTERIN